MATVAAARAPSPPATAAAASSNGGDSDDETRVLYEANALLEKIGFGARKFDRYEDLVASVSSMSVALYEKLFQFRLEHIVRVPKSLAHYEANAQLVVVALSGALLEQRFDVRDVTGESLCAGDARSIQQIVRMFEQIFGILEEANSRCEQVHFATPPRSSASVLSENRSMNTSQSVRLKPAKKLTKKIKKKDRTKSNMDSDSEDDSENKAIHQQRSSRRFQKAEQVASGLPHARNLTGDANLYETSDASITRSRGGTGRPELSAARPKGRTTSVTTTSATTRQTRTHGGQTRSDSANAAVAMKKRSRRLNQSSESSPQYQPNHKDSGTERSTRTKPARSKMPKKSAKNDQGDPNLLETQKYGRFVPVARNNADGSESENEGGSDAAFGGEQMYFGGVSSVSSGSSGSEKSVHFIEEDDEVSRDFASIIDEQNVPPNANLLSPSNAYDDENDRNHNLHRHQSEAVATAREHMKNRTKMTKKSTNQEEEEKEEEHQREDPVSSPPRPKTAPRHQPRSAPEETIGSRVINRKEKDPALSTLYPLLPRGGNAATSKSQTEFMRYKLYLKDHLQDLRQREYCQRQHLERAYKVGEHNANVEKIRARRFEQDIRLQRISIGLEARSEEEKHLRHTLTHILQLEKEKLRDEHRTTSSVLKQIQKDHAERENAMETFYANQIQLVKEQTHREVKERELVEKAHRLASEQMIREMRKEREHQIAALLQEKQHLEEARRFRTATKLSGALQREDEASARAFYTAAMKARQLNARHGSKSAPTVASKKRGKQAAAAYSSVRPAPLSRRVK